MPREQYEDVTLDCKGCGTTFTKNVNIKQKAALRYCSPDCSWRSSFVNREYGITLFDIERMKDEQDGKCSICLTEFILIPSKRICVDHDHKTGEVRGILCASCNTALGLLKDDVDRMTRAVQYLENESAT